MHHLGAILGDATALVLRAHHVARDVLQEQEGDLLGGTQLDEVGGLEGALAEEHAVVGQDAAGQALDVGEAGHQGSPVAGLELEEAAAIHEAGDGLPHIGLAAQVAGPDAQDLVRVVGGGLGAAQIDVGALVVAQVPHHLPEQADGVSVILGEVIGHAADLGVDLGPAQLLGADVLAGGGLHQGRTAQEDGAGALHDDGLVAHGGHIGAAGGAVPHDGAELGDARRGQHRLVVEDAAEVLLVREDLRLQGQEGPTAVHQVKAGQLVLQGDLLGAEVLLHGQGVVGATLHCGVVGYDHAGPALHHTDARHHARRRNRIVVDAHGGQHAGLQEGGAGIAEGSDAVPHEDLALAGVAGLGLLAAPLPEGGLYGFQLLADGQVLFAVRDEFLGGGSDMAVDQRHAGCLSIPKAGSGR